MIFAEIPSDFVEYLWKGSGFYLFHPAPASIENCFSYFFVCADTDIINLFTFQACSPAEGFCMVSSSGFPEISSTVSPDFSSVPENPAVSISPEISPEAAPPSSVCTSVNSSAYTTPAGVTDITAANPTATACFQKKPCHRHFCPQHSFLYSRSIYITIYSKTDIRLTLWNLPETGYLPSLYTHKPDHFPVCIQILVNTKIS